MRKIFFVVLVLSLLCALYAGIAMNAAIITQDGSFENESVGKISNDTDFFSKDWVEKNGLGDPTSFVEEEANNRYLKTEGVLEIQSAKTIQDPYTFSVDIRTNTPLADWMGVFIRTGDVFNLYEWDYFLEKGGTDGVSSIGATGIVIYPVIDGIRLAVKTMENGPWGIGCAYTDILVEGNPNWKSFTNIKVEDDGSIVKIYVGGALAATVEMSGKGTYPEDSQTEIPEFLDCIYYKNVAVKDSAGTERFSVDNARVVAEDYYLGIGIRTKAMDIDNISISKEDDIPTDSDPTPTVKPDQTPDKEPDTGSNPGTGDMGLYTIVAAAILLPLLIKRKVKLL